MYTWRSNSLSSKRPSCLFGSASTLILDAGCIKHVHFGSVNWSARHYGTPERQPAAQPKNLALH
jgi:hypothetical protein